MTDIEIALYNLLSTFLVSKDHIMAAKFAISSSVPLGGPPTHSEQLPYRGISANI
jgi:hypothetical protein